MTDHQTLPKGFDLARLRDLGPFEHGGFRATVDGVGGWGETQRAAIDNAIKNAAKRKRANDEGMRKRSAESAAPTAGGR
jgi:hypothetical protein